MYVTADDYREEWQEKERRIMREHQVYMYICYDDAQRIFSFKRK